MMIRNLQESDISQLREIHSCHFADEFPFEDFLQNIIASFVVVDNDQIIAASSVRKIAESIVITNKDASPRKRVHALSQILQADMFACARNDYSQLHAFVQDNIWLRHLLKIGFRPTKGSALVLNL